MSSDVSNVVRQLLHANCPSYDIVRQLTQNLNQVQFLRQCRCGNVQQYDVVRYVNSAVKSMCSITATSDDTGHRMSCAVWTPLKTKQREIGLSSISSSTRCDAAAIASLTSHALRDEFLTCWVDQPRQSSRQLLDPATVLTTLPDICPSTGCYWCGKLTAADICDPSSCPCIHQLNATLLSYPSEQSCLSHAYPPALKHSFFIIYSN